MLNISDFLDASVSTANDITSTPVPVGEYHGVIEKIIPRQWQSKDGTKSGIAMDIFFLIEDHLVKEHLGRDVVTCKMGLMLDTTPQGVLDMAKGRNIGLGRLREAVGKNTPGEAFSFGMLPGLSAKVNVTHRVSDNNEVFAEIKSVSKL